MKLKMRKLSIVVGVFGTLALFSVSVAKPLFIPSVAHAQASTCQDPIEGWYKCWQKYSTVNTQMDQWCAYADPTTNGGSSKRDQCRLVLMSQIDFSPPGIRATDKCKDAEAVQKSAGDCYVLINSGSWRTALKKFSDNCTFDSPTAKCSETERTKFAEDNKWAISKTSATGNSNKAVNTNDTAQKNAFIDRITTYLRWIISGIGILSVFGLVIAGIQYTAAQDNPQNVAAAKSRINNIIIGILIYLTMFALLQWLIPGGVFSF